MTYDKGMHPGATWRKSDLQCHTPRDPSWEGEPALPGSNLEEEGARKKWASDFINEARSRGLGAIAVTDHHDLSLAIYVMEAAALHNDIVVFPGVEVTCSDNAQCLALFDPSCEPLLMLKFISNLTGVALSEPAAAKSSAASVAQQTVLDLFKLIADDPLLREQCVLLPHFGDENAYKTLNQKGHQTRFAGLVCDGVYIEKDVIDLQPATLDKIQGRTAEWGKRRHAVVVTGDNKSQAWKRLGAHACWIKLGEPSIESLRQALLADEARISYVAPIFPTERIVKLRVKSTLFGSEPLVFSFNEGFNALIGGRGSGKTALLEYLRFALGRANNDLPPSERVSQREREEELVSETLAGGFVEVTLEREGVAEIWKRQSGDTISVSTTSGETFALSVDEARQRFRARAFHQKGLSTTMRDPSNAADQITGIAAAEAVGLRRTLDQAIQNACRTVSTALQQIVSHWQARLELRQAKARTEDLKARLASNRLRLAEHGVSPGDLKTIADASVHGRGKAFLAAAGKSIENDRTRIDAAINGLTSSSLSAFGDAVQFTELQVFDQKATATRAQIIFSLKAAREGLSSLEADRQTALTMFEARLTEFGQQFSIAVERQKANQALLADTTRLTAELEAAEVSEADARSKESNTQSFIEQFSKARDHLSKLLAERRTLLEQAAEQVEGKSSSMLKARLRRDAIPRDYVSSLRDLLERSNIQDVEAKCETWVRSALDGEPNAWRAICDRLLKLYEAKIDTGSPPEPSDEISRGISSLLFGGSPLTKNQTKRVYERLSDARLAAVISAIPRDQIALTYVDERGKSIRFDKASPGQQASALLELLLSQSAGTLIIDQPEDDLDNRVIMRIVELIRMSKNTRQLIFSTHNSNIVVNGDADKVVVLKALESENPEDFSRVQIDQDGGIETEIIRTSITELMEGGKEAFDLRRRKYRFGLAEHLVVT